MAWRLTAALFAFVAAYFIGRTLHDYRHAQAPARAVGFAATEAPPTYRVVVASPVWVCSVPLGGIVIDTPHLAGSITGQCWPDTVFANGFELPN